MEKRTQLDCGFFKITLSLDWTSAIHFSIKELPMKLLGFIQNQNMILFTITIISRKHSCYDLCAVWLMHASERGTEPTLFCGKI